jgi:hypothetical protein
MWCVEAGSCVVSGAGEGEKALIPRLEGGLYKYNLESWTIALCSFQTAGTPGFDRFKSESGRLFNQPCR